MMLPDYVRLGDKLKPYNYSVPDSMSIDEVLPFPHGCAPRQPERIVEYFRDNGCGSLCHFMRNSGYYEGECNKSGQPCFVPLFAHGDVHPSATGHEIARDLIAGAVASTALATCQGQNFSNHSLPTHSGWMVPGRKYGEEL